MASAPIIEPTSVRPRLPYAGEVTPHEAYEAFSRGEAVLVDVRTALEWHEIGHVPGSHLVPWVHGDGERNHNFVADLRQVAQPGQTVLLLCRSAVRSHHAAIDAAQAGYSRVFNVLEGFEGQPDAEGVRGRIDGWQAAWLPWQLG